MTTKHLLAALPLASPLRWPLRPATRAGASPRSGARPGTAPAPAPPPAPAPAPTFSDWTDAPQTPGNWFYIPQAPYSVAAFGPNSTQPLFRCAATRRGTRSRSGAASAPMVDNR